MDAVSCADKTTKVDAMARTGPMPGLSSCVTTSWDDGHPLDLRVADLLSKYQIRGTFYVPRIAERETMMVSEIRSLSTAFEIGAHTIRHAVLSKEPNEVAWQEISRSKAWVEDSTGTRCLLFCPPQGRYKARHLEMVRQAGYVGLRGTELVSLDFPRRQAGLLLMPTTLQAHPHGLLAFTRNAVKRRAFGNLWRLIVHGGTAEWHTLAESLLRYAVAHGGVFHLWGHSWELEEQDQWQRLNDILRLMSEIAGQAPSLTNGEICQRDLARSSRSVRGTKPLVSRRRGGREIIVPQRKGAPDGSGDLGGAIPS